jgi:hypothetical protein
MVIQGKARRFVLGMLIALLLTLFVREAVAQMIPTPQVCRETTPADWAWWENWCWNYPASGGSLMHSGFLVR